MIGFVVPVKPRILSKDWQFDNLLLERTAKSICAQTDQNFKLVIVYQDEPEIRFSHPNMTLVQFPFPWVSADEFEDLDYVLKYYPKDYAEKMMDKGKKIHFGCKQAIDAGCAYIMAVDSDDLISNKLSEFVNARAHSNTAGWRIQRGFIYVEGSLILVKKYDIQNINGSTHIIRKDLITVSDFSRNIFWNYNLFEAHGYTWRRIKDHHNEVLEDYPLFGIVYVAHKNNYSSYLGLAGAKTIKNVVKKIVRGRLLTKSIRDEFGLYKLDVTAR